MQSRLLVEYLRTGWIAPLKKGASKELVESELGPPEDWKGRVGGIGWSGHVLTDFHESWAWHYGSLCVSFLDVTEQSLPGISLDLGFGDLSGPIRFPALFAELPQSPFTVGELVGLMDEQGVRHHRRKSGLLVSEGDIAISTSDGKYSPNERVLYLFPHSDEPIIGPSRSRRRQRMIESITELLHVPDLPAADRQRWEESLRKLKVEEAMQNK